MNKWLPKLTEEEFKELHGLIYCDDVTEVKWHGDFAYVYENWPDEDGDRYIETEYEYNDFDLPQSWDTSEAPLTERNKFYSFMIKKFGTPYLRELLEYHFDLSKPVLQRCFYEVKE